jgi:hypothetical protein
MARKIIEDPVVYWQKQKALHELVQSLAHVTLDVQKHNVNEIPTDLTIIFIDKEDMPLFAPMVDDDIRTCKIVNYNKPAVELSFFSKHKYYVKKEVNPTALATFLQEQLFEQKQQIDKLKSEILKEGNIDSLVNLLGDYVRGMGDIEEIIEHLEEYEVAISNYEMGYTYTELSYKYEEGEGKYSNENSHIIKDRNGKACMNVIFIDPVAIQQPVANQQKKVDSFLASFPIRFVESSKIVYLKKRE